MKTLYSLGALAILLSALLASQNHDTNPQKLVAPSAYTYIPKTLRAALDKRGCQLPQLANYDGKTRLNAVSGHFLNATQIDWAAFCIVNDHPRVVVLWGGSAKAACSEEISTGWPLEQSFAHEAGGRLLLGKASVKEILEYRKFFGDTNSNPVTHEGINVGDEKASLIYYCDGKKWLQLQGDD